MREAQSDGVLARLSPVAAGMGEACGLCVRERERLVLATGSESRAICQHLQERDGSKNETATHVCESQCWDSRQVSVPWTTRRTHLGHGEARVIN